MCAPDMVSEADDFVEFPGVGFLGGVLIRGCGQRLCPGRRFEAAELGVTSKVQHFRHRWAIRRVDRALSSVQYPRFRSKMSRQTLHELVDRISEQELSAAERFLEYLAVSPAYRAALSAPPDDEPVTDSDAAAIGRAEEDVRAGRVVPHEEVLREFGLR